MWLINLYINMDVDSIFWKSLLKDLLISTRLDQTETFLYIYLKRLSVEKL
jgi:hypothetical protein